jgi:hypothetical protein
MCFRGLGKLHNSIEGKRGCFGEQSRLCIPRRYGKSPFYTDFHFVAARCRLFILRESKLCSTKWTRGVTRESVLDRALCEI